MTKVEKAITAFKFKKSLPDGDTLTKDENRDILSSYNKKYEDWPVYKEDILHLFLVKGYENQQSL